MEELSFITLNTMNQPNAPLEKKRFFLDKLLIDIMSKFQLAIDKGERYSNFCAASIGKDY